MKNILAALLILAHTVCLSQETKDALANTKKHYNNGAIAYSQGEFTGAIKSFSKALEYRSGISDNYLLCDIYMNRALCRMNLGSNDALSDATEAVNLKPEYAKTHYIRAMVYINILQDADKALADINQALELKPSEPDFLFLKSTCYRIKKQPEEGLKVINQILESDPGSIDAIRGRGEVYLEMHKYEDAAKDFKKILEIKPGEFGSLCNLASCMCELQRYEEAQEVYLKAIESDTSQAYIIYNNIGYFVNMKEKNYKKAIASFDKAIAQNPKFGFSYSNRAYAKLMDGDTKGAMKDVNRSLELAPKNSYAYKNRALIFIAENKISSACLDLKKAQELGYSKQYDNEVTELQEKHCK
jgi:tetratricopeptide (TPR) repeat protein